MLPKARRLKKNEIDYILKKGSESSSKLFIIRQIEKKDDGLARFCIIVSRKVSNKAVIRNKIRRRTYEAIRNHLDQITNHQVDTVLIPKKRILNSDYQEIKEDIINILNGKTQ